MQPISIEAYTSTNAAGIGNVAVAGALLDRKGGLRPNDFGPARALSTWIGRVEGLEATALPDPWLKYDCRNNRLACLALRQDHFADRVAEARERHGADRVGCLIGSSTSGMLETELAFRNREGAGVSLPADVDFTHRQSLFSVTDFVRGYLALRGPAWTISTACTSSAKVFAAAARMLDQGLCDAAVVGGVDSLCLTTMYGFHSLELLSDRPCQPFAAGRTGISIGEGAGFALLSREKNPATGCRLVGWGESSDGYHISTPSPDGAGALAAMRQALARADLQPQNVDYVNLHGTGTLNNDRSEESAVFGLFGSDTPCSSTKGWTGHTLGASGITEAVISLLCQDRQVLPENLNTADYDSAFRCAFVARNRRARLEHVLSNSFGFGGSNCSLIFSCAGR